MANCGPNTNSSQFFITFDACPWLDGNHVVFGKVVEGHNILGEMEKVGTKTGNPRINIDIVDSGEMNKEETSN